MSVFFFLIAAPPAETSPLPPPTPLPTGGASAPRPGPPTAGGANGGGNRQYLGTGNLLANDKVSIIFMNYAERQRLKVLGRATVHADPSPELIEQLGAQGVRVDGAVTVEIEATAWNCPKHITPRFTQAQVEGAVTHLTERIAELEAQLEAVS